MRILDVINKTTPYFEKQEVESPRLTIELLLAHLLKKKRLQLYLEFERELDETTLTALRKMVKRRVAGDQGPGRLSLFQGHRAPARVAAAMGSVPRGGNDGVCA